MSQLGRHFEAGEEKAREKERWRAEIGEGGQRNKTIVREGRFVLLSACRTDSLFGKGGGRCTAGLLPSLHVRLCPVIAKRNLIFRVELLSDWSRQRELEPALCEKVI